MESPESPKMSMAENEDITARIQSASSIEELVQILESIPKIEGSRHPYTGAEIAERVKAYIKTERGVDVITHSNKIREKVLELSGNKSKEN